MRSRLRRTLLISADPLSSATIADQARMPVARGDLRGRRRLLPRSLVSSSIPKPAAHPGCARRGARGWSHDRTAEQSLPAAPLPVGEVLIVTTDEGIVTLHPLRDRLEDELERLSRALRQHARSRG